METNGQPAVHFEAATWQRLETLLMTPETDFNPAEDRYMRMHFPEQEPITFYFIGVPPPGRESKDAESWVHPAFLSLLLPLCLDIKVVASESSLPLLNEASELRETVYLDGAHAAIGYITGKERLNLDQVWPTLNRLATTYLIHIDGNSEAGGKDFYRWQALPAVARHLAESPMYAFHYLKKWQRKANRDALSTAKAELYLRYYHYLENGDKNAMTHAQTLTTLYRQFYRTRGAKSHAIVRPLSIAAEALLDADRRLFDSQDALVEAVHGRLYVRIRQLFRENLAFPPGGSKLEEQNDAITEFARYFVDEVFFGAFRGDVAALRGKQLNLLKNACEVLYRTADAAYWRERKAAGEPVDADLEAALTDE
ncbi:MAG: type I-D CRISPR-associated protein Cas10d/Csc3 [Caldilineaceae bacterium]